MNAAHHENLLRNLIIVVIIAFTLLWLAVRSAKPQTLGSEVISSQQTAHAAQGWLAGPVLSVGCE